MKYIITILLMFLFISAHVDENKTVSEVFKNSLYSYITCCDNAFVYLSNNVDIISKLTEKSYQQIYDKVMQNRNFTEHLITSGETLDDIIKNYNTNIDNIDDFRKIIYKENPNSVSSSYEIKSGDSIKVPTDYL